MKTDPTKSIPTKTDPTKSVPKKTATMPSNQMQTGLGSGNNRAAISARILNILVKAAAVTVAAILLFIVGFILIKGVLNINLDLFALTYNSLNHSLLPALINTLLMIVLSLAIAFPLGLGSAIYLVEYTRQSNRFVRVIRLTAETLTGIPSIIYGLFGLLFFVMVLKWRMSLLSGSLTIATMILPVILRTSEEALKSVPDSYREGSFSLGAGRLRTVFRVILPAALPGIMAGIILSIGRVFGESAALIYTAGTVAAIPGSVLDSTRTLSVHMYMLASEGLYIDQAYATAVVLLAIVVIINLVSARLARRLTSVY